ncbi:MAG TPA: hypothetical protein VIP28_11170, partial [Nocardioides sp.]
DRNGSGELLEPGELSPENWRDDHLTVTLHHTNGELKRLRESSNQPQINNPDGTISRAERGIRAVADKPPGQRVTDRTSGTA